MDLSIRRVREAIAWRAGALYWRLPRRVRVWIENRLLPRRVRRGSNMFDRERLTRSYRRAWEILLSKEQAGELGDYVEFGVYYGTSLSCMHDALEQVGLRQRMFGFDSFEGLPESAAREDDAEWVPGQFKASLQLAEEYLERHGVPRDRVTLTKGWFSDTLTPATAERYAIRHASVLMVDCDLYSSACEALAFSAPLIGRQAVVYFDDWNAGGLADKGMGERRAFEEFLAEHRDLTAEPLDELNYKDKSDVKVFLVTRTPPSGDPATDKAEM